MNKAIRSMPADQVAREIAALNRLNVDVTDYETIAASVSALMTGMSVECIDVPSTEQLFRVRLNPESKPKEVREIGAPPSDLVTGYQRCNPPGRPMFYSASTRNTALSECRAKPGDRFYLSQWMPKTTYPAIVTMSRGLSDVHTRFSNRDITIYSYFDTLFTRRIHETFSKDYMLTAAFSELLRAKTKRPNSDGSTFDHYVSLRYPSVAAIGTGVYNTVMHADWAEEVLGLNHVMEGTVVRECDGTFDVEVSDNAVDFCDGIIHWTGDGQRIPLLKLRKSDGKSGVQFVVGHNAKGEKAIFLCTLSSGADNSYLRCLLDEPGCFNPAQQSA